MIKRRGAGTGSSAAGPQKKEKGNERKMHSRMKTAVLAGLLCAAPAVMHAQFDFTVDGRQFQVHSFVSQGFAYSNDNNYLTMNTSQGTFAMTDAGVNVSTQITDKFRVAAQVYDRNMGKLGEWHPTLDFAFADYKFKDWFGIRAGKVKTVLGLFNDTQDMEFLHTFAILPQSMYPLDLRASTIAHTGGDVYGTFGIKKLGEISYTGYAGWQSFDKYGGYVYGSAAQGLNVTSLPARQFGGDLRWSDLVRGLLVGASVMHAPATGYASTQVAATVTFHETVWDHDNTVTFYMEYKIANLALDGEYRRDTVGTMYEVGPLPAGTFGQDARGWYVSAAYRVAKRLELGTYESRYYPVWGQNPAPPTNHIYDTVAAAKFELTGHWDLKIEEHFMDGYGLPYSFRGFYPQQNPAGLKPKTDMLVVRTGWNF
jgi:hypothetical protein